jgi:cytochrome c-type biogenesis protein CcmH
MTARRDHITRTFPLAAALLLMSAVASADPSTPAASLANTQLRNPAQEAEARDLMGSLRCLVCQGQSIADSDAAMAGDMRALVRERIREGDSPAAVRRWLIDRYGDYVTYDPPLGAATWPLWAAPLVLLLIGAAVARSSFRRRR